jgi:hypothetical protein
MVHPVGLSLRHFECLLFNEEHLAIQFHVSLCDVLADDHSLFEWWWLDQVD